jgi:hypothetical protein
MLERLVSRTRLSWYGFTALVSSVLLFLAISTAYLDGILGEFFSAGHWRGLLSHPVIFAYLLVLVPLMGQSQERALRALRPLVPLDDQDFNSLLGKASVGTPKGESIALSIGIALSLLSFVPAIVGGGFSWVRLNQMVGTILALPLLCWEIYGSFAGTKRIAAVFGHLSNVDVFNIRPFEPMGRYSLAVSMTFIGGATIGMLFNLGTGVIFSIPSLIGYGIFALIAVLVFFLSMRDTHRVLDTAKDEELQALQLHIADTYRSLADMPIGSPDISALAAKLNLWKEYEKRLKAARTWPYNLRMLRTLGLSVLTPVALNVAQRLIGMLFS